MSRKRKRYTPFWNPRGQGRRQKRRRTGIALYTSNRRRGYGIVRGRYSGGRPEAKFHDIALNDAVVASAGTITPTINIIVQGIDESQRIGRKVTITKIMWRYFINLKEIPSEATPAAPDTVRVILYWDKQCNKATATVTDILETATIRSFNNLSNKGRFNILMDRMHTLNYLTLTGDQDQDAFSSALVRETFSFYKSCSIPIEYNAALGAITEITTNNLGVLLISEAGTAVFNSDFRLRFTDV